MVTEKKIKHIMVKTIYVAKCRKLRGRRRRFVLQSFEHFKEEEENLCREVERFNKMSLLIRAALR